MSATALMSATASKFDFQKGRARMVEMVRFLSQSPTDRLLGAGNVAKGLTHFIQLLKGLEWGQRASKSPRNGQKCPIDNNEVTKGPIVDSTGSWGLSKLGTSMG